MTRLRERRCWLYWLLGGIILALALWLRLENAQTRQFHADEGVQAYQAWRLIETGEYRYDPREHHGPLLYYLVLWTSSWLQDQAGDLSDFSVRLVPLVFSVAAALLALVTGRRIGRVAGLLWALLLAFAPLCVIYGAYFVQESLLMLLTLLSLYFLHRYSDRPTPAGAAAVGTAWGLMLVAKETAVIHIAIGLALAVALNWRSLRNAWPLELKRLLRHIGWTFLPIALLHVAFFSSFGKEPSGVWDGIVTYFGYLERAGGQGHEKPMGYYLGLLWPHTREGARWGELGFLGLAILGGLFLLRSSRDERTDARRLICLISGFGGLCLLAYSLIPYKTPWLLLTPYAALSATVAYGLARLARVGPVVFGRWRPIGIVLSIGLGGWALWDLAQTVRLALFRYPSDSRNPYLYEHTTPRYSMLLSRLEGFRSQGLTLGVYSPDAAWPLPWHLRDWDRVGYWTSLESFEPHDLDLLDTRLTGDALPGQAADASWELYGLRPNTLLSLRIAGSTSLEVDE